MRQYFQRAFLVYNKLSNSEIGKLVHRVTRLLKRRVLSCPHFLWLAPPKNKAHVIGLLKTLVSESSILNTGLPWAHPLATSSISGVSFLPIK